MNGVAFVTAIQLKRDGNARLKVERIFLEDKACGILESGNSLLRQRSNSLSHAEQLSGGETTFFNFLTNWACMLDSDGKVESAQK